MERKRIAALTSRIAVLVSIVIVTVTMLTTCSAADGLIGIHSAFLPGFNQVPAPTVVAASSGIEVGASTTLTASGSGAGAVYNWSIVTGGGAVDATGDTASFTASATPETVTISTYASMTGFQDSESVLTTVLVSDLPFLDAPTITFDEGTSTVFVDNLVNVTASGSGAGVTYNWTVTGIGSIASTGSTVGYTAPSSEETATVSVYASAAGSNDSPTTNASVTVKDNHFALLYSDILTNINLAAAAALDWSNTSVDATYFSRPSTTELEVLVDGDYFLALTIPMQTTVQRSSVRAEVRVNGTLYPGAISESSYIRNNTGDHSESSDHVAILLPGLTAGDDIEVFTVQAAMAGTVTITDQATLYVEYLEPSRMVFSGSSADAMDVVDLYVDPGSPVSILWTQQISDTGFTHSDIVNAERIVLDSPGYYMVFANIPLYILGTDSNNRVNVEMMVQLNGSTVAGGQAKQGYIRRQDSHQNASLHWSGIVRADTANSVLTFVAHKESGATIPDQLVTMNSKKATVFVEKIDTSALVYSARATRPVVGSDWNTASAEVIAWETDEVMDTVTYTHSTVLFDSHEITFNRSGDYLVAYNDALIVSGADIRLNPRIQLHLDGSPVPGAQTKSHYLRNEAVVPDDSGNFESSGSLVFYLQGVTTGQVLTITTQAEGETASQALADDFALLTIIRKK